MKNIIILFGILIMLMSCQTSNEKIDKEAIIEVMRTQEEAWSQNDLEAFMQGYWENDSLKFYGSSGLTFGWDKTLANYKKGYPTKDHSGQLKFIIDTITKIEYNAYYVMGQYHLKRNVGDANGVFMIVFRKIDGVWKIVADMSC